MNVQPEAPWSPASVLAVFFALVFGILWPPSPSYGGDTAFVSIKTNTGSDTLVVGALSSIDISFDSGVDSVAEARFSLEWQFSQGNFVGPLQPPEQPEYSQKSEAAFTQRLASFGNGSDPETTFVRMTDFGSSQKWIGSGEAFRYTFVPTDTGTIHINPTFQGLTPEEYTAITRWPDLVDMVLVTQAPLLVCRPCIEVVVTGELNRDGLMTASDIIVLVNYVFKDGHPPSPVSEAGDVNCSGSVTSADIIAMVNFVFKSGDEFCDVCSIL